jgi:long-chain acyl-CoA synthetase
MASAGNGCVIGENSYSWCLSHAAVINGSGLWFLWIGCCPKTRFLGFSPVRCVGSALDGAFHPVMQKAAATLPGIRRFVCIRSATLKLPEGEDPFIDPVEADAREGSAFLRISDLAEEGKRLLVSGRRDYVDAPIDPGAMASLLYTSGTTSASKAEMLSHGNIAADIRGMAEMIDIPSGTRMLSILPLHHTFENTCGLYMALFVGAEIHEWDGLRYIHPNLNEYGIDMLIGVPAVFESFYGKVKDTLRKTGKTRTVAIMRKLTRTLRLIGIDLRRKVFQRILDAFGGRLAIGICGAAPIDPEIIRFFDDIGVRIYQGYGLTETSPVVAGCNSKVFVAGTVGQPVGGVEVGIDNERDGEEGEILVRGPIVMLGYYDAPELTAEVIDADGWFHTGDVGRIDPKTHCLSITGRIKSMIVLKNGKKVFPEELEFLIGQFDYIKEAMVWGDEDADGDVVLSAKFVVDRSKLEERGQAVPDETELKTMLDDLVKKVNAAMPSFKSIRYYVFGFQEMVKTTTLKIKRNIEVERVRSLMARTCLKWKELTGRNIDHLTESDPGQGNGSAAERSDGQE